MAFDAGKESHHVLSHTCPEGPNFKILGILFDCGLRMAAAVHELIGECHWKIRSLLRLSRYHTQSEMVQLYKSQVLSFVEYRAPGIYNACDSTLQKLNAVQDHYLKEIGIDARTALFDYKLAPLPTRRDIAMLGLIHRTVLGKGPEHFATFFFPATAATHRFRTRRASRVHSRQIQEHLSGRFLDVVKRSCLGLASVYNILPAEIVSANSLKCFQGRLQDLVKDQTERHCDWPRLLSPRHWLHAHPLLRV